MLDDGDIQIYESWSEYAEGADDYMSPEDMHKMAEKIGEIYIWEIG